VAEKRTAISLDIGSWKRRTRRGGLVKMFQRGGCQPTCPATNHVELPTRSVEPHGPLLQTEVEVCCGNVGDVVEIVG